MISALEGEELYTGLLTMAFCNVTLPLVICASTSREYVISETPGFKFIVSGAQIHVTPEETVTEAEIFLQMFVMLASLQQHRCLKLPCSAQIGFVDIHPEVIVSPYEQVIYCCRRLVEGHGHTKGTQIWVILVYYSFFIQMFIMQKAAGSLEVCRDVLGLVAGYKTSYSIRGCFYRVLSKRERLLAL